MTHGWSLTVGQVANPSKACTNKTLRLSMLCNYTFLLLVYPIIDVLFFLENPLTSFVIWIH